MRGQRRNTETSIINKYVVKDAQGKWTLALDNHELQEKRARQTYKNSVNSTI